MEDIVEREGEDWGHFCNLPYRSCTITKVEEGETRVVAELSLGHNCIGSVDKTYQRT